MSTERKYVVVMLATFLGALTFVAGLNRLVDPFAYNPSPLLTLDQQQLSEQSHDRLLRLARYRYETPKPAIILGDSRGRSLKEAYFESAGTEVANLAFGGGTLFEAIDTFWFAVGLRKPEHVVLVLPFNLWSESNDFNRVTEATNLLSSPLRYHLSYFVGWTAARNLWRNMTHDTVVSSAPPMSRAAFWDFQLSVSVADYYRVWKEPRRLRERFNAMAEHCRRNAIALIIVIPPTHLELQKRIADFGLVAAHERFLAEMHRAAPVIDFESETALIEDAANFDDPFHAKPAVMRDLARRIAERLRLVDTLTSAATSSPSK